MGEYYENDCHDEYHDNMLVLRIGIMRDIKSRTIEK